MLTLEESEAESETLSEEDWKAMENAVDAFTESQAAERYKAWLGE
jgi:hypothetical protein